VLLLASGVLMMLLPAERSAPNVRAERAAEAQAD
jgi:hypothetical protein